VGHQERRKDPVTEVMRLPPGPDAWKGNCPEITTMKRETPTTDEERERVEGRRKGLRGGEKPGPLL